MVSLIFENVMLTVNVVVVVVRSLKNRTRYNFGSSLRISVDCPNISKRNYSSIFCVFEEPAKQRFDLVNIALSCQERPVDGLDVPCFILNLTNFPIIL